MKNEHMKYLFLPALLGGLLGGGLAWLGLTGTGNALLNLGVGLRALSLSGWTGNLAAWTVVCLVSLWPLALLLLRRKRSKRDTLLPLLSVLLLAACFLLINPALLDTVEPYLLALLWTAAGVLLTWGVLTLAGQFTGDRFLPLPLLFQAGAALLAALVGFTAVLRLWGQVAAVQAGNTGAPEAAMTTGTVLGALTLVRLLPDLLGGWLLLQGSELGRQMEGNPFAPETVELCRATAKNALWCVNLALGVYLGCNLLQLLLPGLLHLDVQLLLPLPTLLAAAGLLVLCRYMVRSKAVYDDNQTII